MFDFKKGVDDRNKTMQELKEVRDKMLSAYKDWCDMTNKKSIPLFLNDCGYKDTSKYVSSNLVYELPQGIFLRGVDGINLSFWNLTKDGISVQVDLGDVDLHIIKKIGDIGE